MISFAIWILLGSLSTCLALNCHFIHAICDYLQASTVVIHGAMDDGVYPDLLTCAANGLPVFIQVFSANEPGNRFQAKDKSIVHFVSRSDAHIGLVQRKYFLHHWFLPQDFDDGQLYLRQDSRVFKYKSNRTNKSISVSEIYAFKNQTRYQNHLGSFDQKSFSLPSPFSTEGVWSRRGNLKGATLQGVMAEYEIFNFKDDNGHYAGACVDIFKVMSNVANFSFKFIDAPDGSYGATKDGTTWGGIVGELMAGHADYGGALMGVSKERSDVIDYTLSIYQDMVTLHHFESGYQTQLNFKAYADVLHSWSWMAILCTLLVLDVALIFITCIHNHGHPFILDNSSLVFATLIQRDTPISIRTWSAKVLFYFACLFGLLIFSSYAALLTSTMIFSPGGIVLETLDDVIANGYDLLIWKDSFSHQIFIDSKPGTSFYNAYQHYFVEDSEEGSFISSVSEAYDLLKQPKQLAYMDTLALRSYSSVKTVSSFKDTRSARLAFAMPQNSELLDLFNHILFKMHQSGILDRIFKEWNLRKSYDARPSDQEALPLEYSNVFIPFMIFIGGVSGAIVLAFLELIMSCCCTYFRLQPEYPE